MSKALVLYFSVYGSTRWVAAEIAKQTGADLTEMKRLFLLLMILTVTSSVLSLTAGAEQEIVFRMDQVYESETEGVIHYNLYCRFFAIHQSINGCRFRQHIHRKQFRL